MVGGYEDWTAPERAALDAWNQVSDNPAAMLAIIRDARAARERLARHLFLEDSGSIQGDAAGHWDADAVVSGTRRRYLERADEYLAVIAGKED